MKRLVLISATLILSLAAFSQEYLPEWTEGHVVVRVFPGGDSYQIFVLDSRSLDYKVIFKTDIINLQ